MGIVIGIIIVLGLAAFFAFLTIKSKSSDLFKWVGIAAFIAFCLTWVLPFGSFQEGIYYKNEMQRLGFVDVSSILYYCVYFCLTNVLFFFAVAGFYGVLSKTDSYNALVRKLGNRIKNREILSTAIISIIIIALVSFTGNTYAWILFLPFIVSVLIYAKLDKMTAFTTTYGSVLAGVLATTYGTGSLSAFNYYVGTDVFVGIKYRLIFALVVTIVYVLFNALRLRKKLQKKLVGEKDADLFEVEETKSKKDSSIWYPVVLFVVLLVIAFLGFFQWSSFKIEVFDKFHTWLTGLKFGENFTLFGYLLGTSALAFGHFEITSIMTLVILLTILTGVVNRMSLKDFAENYASGFAKFVKPVCLFILSYAAFVIVYITPVVPGIVAWFNGLTKTFNPFLSTIAGLISSFFHADLGYTGYVVSSVITTAYAKYTAIAHTVYVSTYGIANMILPTSGVLLFGLAYLKVDYKTWFKYIWLVAVIAIVVLLILATIVRYAL